MKRNKLVGAVGAALLLLSACGGGATDETGGDHSHSPGTDDHAHGNLAFGEPGDPSQADRTIEIVAKDGPFRFEPDSIDVAAGVTVVLDLVNEGGVQHELAILAAPTEEVTSGHEHGNDPNATPRVDPGGSEQVVWTFTEPGEFVFECHVDAHHLAGMRGTITVSG